MNQQKTGEFLKHLRKNKGLTQEQLAEHFYVSSRTVSRWETGSNMPDLDMLIDLAEFYDVDIREIIDGERKSENMDMETKDTLKKVAEYTDEQNKKLKMRRIVVYALTSILVIIFCFSCMCYALGYRWDSKAAADLSGRLNFESKMITCFEWKDDLHFYIYDSYSCYDVICVERTSFGWKTVESCLNWPKWSMYDETTGIETAGALCHFQNYEGVQIFPVIPYDENVKTVEVTCYEKTQTKEVKAGELTLFTFDAIFGQSNTIEAIAYDAEGNAIYCFDEWTWLPVE